MMIGNVSNSDRYMFSESAGLLCRVLSESLYEVVNGAWHGRRDGDTFTVGTDRTGHSSKITDWVEVYPRYWSLEWQKDWYYGR